MTDTATAPTVARKIVQRKISDLIAAEYNPRQLTKDQHKALRDSLTRFGFVDPALINMHPDRTNIIIGGHQRIKVWAEMGNTKAPCCELSLGRDQERELNIRLNQNSGEWDFDLLANNFDLGDLVEWGFTEDELTGFGEPAEVIEDETPDPPDDPITESGRIYQLGRHRLMCGDSTSEADVKRLMDGETAHLLLADPPYGIDVVGASGKIGGSVMAKNAIYSPVIGDQAPYHPQHLMGLAEQSVIWGANYFHDELPRSGAWIVWDKGRPEGTTFSDCELAWTDAKKTAINCYRVVWHGMIREGESEKRTHPTQKPLKLFAAIICDYSPDDATVLDPFGGSGSTLIACEQTDRACRMMEIDPRYCDVIVRRYANLVKTDAQAIFDTGAHLVEVAA